MKKSLLYRLFGLGKMPAEAKTALDGEGIIFSDEGLKASVTYLNFSSPGRRSNWRRQWYAASIALTEKRLVAFAFSNKIIDLPVTDERFRRLEISVEEENTLLVRFDASLFQQDWSGTLEYRFKTEHARAFLDRLKAIICRAK